MRGRSAATLLSLTTAAVAASQWQGRTSGSTASERSRGLPGDDIVPTPTVVTNHARTLRATPEEVWPWLTQVGWHRGGWYTARWVDRLLFPANWPSADWLDPDLLRDLAVGDVIADGPPGTAHFVVAQVDEARLLVLHSTTHIPGSWQKKTGARIDWVWIFTLEPASCGGTRMLIRTRASTSPWWLTAAYVGALIPADHIMATSMLRGLDKRSGRTP